VVFSANSRVFRDFWRFRTQTVAFHNGMLPKKNDFHQALVHGNKEISSQNRTFRRSNRRRGHRNGFHHRRSTGNSALFRTSANGGDSRIESEIRPQSSFAQNQDFRLSTKQINARLNDHPAPQIVPYSLHSVVNSACNLQIPAESTLGQSVGLALRRPMVSFSLCNLTDEFPVL
jgi:hypothetical protein